MTLGTVSEVPTPWWTLQDDIRRAGLDPDSIERVTDQAHGRQCRRRGRGRLDVAQLFEPFASLMERDGTGHVWHEAASRGPTSYTTYYSTAANIAEYAPEFRAMIRGLAATQRWFMASTPEEIAATIASYFPAMEQKPARRLHRPLPGFGHLDGRSAFPARALEPAGSLDAQWRRDQRAPGYANYVDDAIVTEALQETA